MSAKKRVLVAMSGGVDSTVAAVLLKNEGYEVVGVTMKTWDYTHTKGIQKKETGCCSLESFNDARAAAVRYNFPHYILDIREAFEGEVIEDFVQEYMAGRTPNPCVLCNTRVKWDVLMKKADALACDYIATGHYARIRRDANRYVLTKSVDKLKDQTYVLWGLSQAVLARTLFPLGTYEKPQVRALAAELGLHEVAHKKESYEICFIPDNDYRNFLAQRYPDHVRALEGGLFKDKNGNILGTHKGYPFFTIGQRRGLGIALGRPTFVTHIDAENNVVVLGDISDLQESSMSVRKLNCIKYERLPEGVEVVTKIRHRDAGMQSRLQYAPSGTEVGVRFMHPVAGVAPGQSAVFYEGDDVLGGGFIDRKFLD